MVALTLIAYYVLFWWVTLFAVLSIGLRTQDEEGEVVLGTDPSAPGRPRFLRILVLNTLISGVLFAGWYYLTEMLGFGVADIPSIYPQDR